MLLDCEEIVQEWKQWRTVNDTYLSETRTFEIPQAPLKAFAGSSSSSVPLARSQSSGTSQWRTDLLDKQDSQPPNAIQKAYAHPAWIPLARDWGGNNIAIDLAPGPTGRWGQVILIGRDYDCKYVVSRSWSAFLATLADDMHTDKWFIDEDTLELKLREFKQQGVEPAYIDILRWRSDQKYGRRAPKRPVRTNSSPSLAQNGFSPYGSPTKEDRGRSPNRYSNGKAPAHHAPSPRGLVGSPLARVTEESTPAQRPLKVDTTFDPSKMSSSDKLISGIETPASATMRSGNKFDTPNELTNGYPRSRLGSNIVASDEDEIDDELVAGQLSPPPQPETKAGASKGGLQDVDLEGEMRDVKI
jgi:cell wall assembly regulator SMI1